MDENSVPPQPDSSSSEMHDQTLKEELYNMHRSVNLLAREALNIISKSNPDYDPIKSAKDLRDIVDKLSETLKIVEREECHKEVYHIGLHLGEIYDAIGEYEKAQESFETVFFHAVEGNTITHRSISKFLDLSERTQGRIEYLSYIQQFLASDRAGPKSSNALRKLNGVLWQRRLRRLHILLQSTPLDLQAIIEITNSICNYYDLTPSDERGRWFGILLEARKLLQNYRQKIRKEANESKVITQLMINLLLRLIDYEGDSKYKRFKNLYDLFKDVRLQEEFWPQLGGVEGIQKLVVECYKAGKALFDSDNLVDINERRRHGGGLHYYMGDICQAFTENMFRGIEVEDLKEKLNSGVDHLRQATQDELRHIHTFHQLGHCYQGLEKYREAIECYQKLLNAPPGANVRSSVRFDANIEIAKSYKALGFMVLKEDQDLDVAKQHWNLAEQHFIAAHRLNEPNPAILPWQTKEGFILGLMADFYFEIHRPSEALPYYEAIMNREKQTPSSDKGLYDLYSYRWAVALTYCGRYEEAREHFEETLLRKPEQEFVHLVYNHLIRVCKILRDDDKLQDVFLRRWEAGVDKVDDTLITYPAIVLENDVVAKATFAQECQNYLSEGQYSKLLSCIQRLFKEARTWRNTDVLRDKVILTCFGQAYQRLGDFVEAERIFLKVKEVQQTPKNQAITLYHLGDLYLNWERFEDAAKAYEDSYNIGQALSSKMRAATACRLAGKYDEALQHIRDIIASGRDEAPHKTRTILARTLWKQGKVNQEDIIWACTELCRVLEGELGVEYTDDSESISCLMKMIAAPETGLLVADVVLKRLCDLGVGIKGRGLIKVISQAVVHAYYYGTVGGKKFEEFVAWILDALLKLGEDTRRHWIFELLVTERHASLTVLIARYAEEAIKVLSPITGDLDTARISLKNTKLLDSINSFLRRKIPESIVPVAYRRGDSIELNPLVEELIEDLCYELNQEIESGNSLDFVGAKGGNCSISTIGWLMVRSLLRDLLNVDTGPFASIFSEAAPWSVEVVTEGCYIDMVFIFGQIEPTHAPEDILYDVRQKLESRCSMSEIKNNVRSDLQGWDSEHRARISIDVPKAHRLSEDFVGLIDFVEYLANESRRILKGGGLNPNFYYDSEKLFWKAGTVPFQASLEKWVELIGHLLGIHYAITASWLLSPATTDEESGRHPRTAVHKVKQKVDLAMRGGNLSDVGFTELRKEIFRLTANIIRVVRAEVHGITALSTDIRVILDQVIGQVSERVPDVQFRVVCPPESYVLIHPTFLTSAILDLIHNSVKAISDPGVSKQISVIVTTREPAEKVSITISNPYDPNRTHFDASTGIGYEEVEYLIESLAGGTVDVRPDEKLGIYEVTLMLSAPVVDQIAGGNYL